MGRRGRGGGGRARGAVPRNNSGTYRGGLNAPFPASADDSYHNKRQYNGHPQPQFSLSEEARNTGSHRSWNPDLRLRNSGITFISAGTSKAEDLTQVLQEKVLRNSECTQSKNVEDITKDVQSHPTEQGNGHKIALQCMGLSDAHIRILKMDGYEAPAIGEIVNKPAQEEPVTESIFFTDTKGSNQLHTVLPPPEVRRSPSLAASDSSGEVILFTGRNTSQIQIPSNSRVSEGPVNRPDIVSRGYSEGVVKSCTNVPKVVDDMADLIVQHDPRATQSSIPDKLSFNRDINRGAALVPGKGQGPAKSGQSTCNRKKTRRGKRPKKANKEAEIMEDYILNALDSEEFRGPFENSMLNGRDLGGFDVDQWVDEEEEPSAVKSQPKLFEQAEGDWDSADLRDFDEFSTSSEAPDAIEHVISKRERPSGVQYLVVGVGFTVEDARWLPTSLLEDSGASTKIQQFEDRQAKIERLFTVDEDSEDNLTMEEQLVLDLQEQLDNLEDERNLEDRRKERMTDEQIARLLGKQEELGLGSDDLVLFDGDDLAEAEIENAQLDGTWGRPKPPQAQSKSKRNKYSEPSFPSATAFADILDQDPYNGFDVMDHERPSLRKKSKGRRQQLPLELSDSDLEQTINAAWENDRTKKKIRKQDREELRAQGLLGKEGKVDMKAKYREGMTMDQLKAEIREFLLSSMESLPLPPMAQKERKIIHEIANVFKLKSKSIGSGTSRYPVLYRTARTTQYDNSMLKSIDATLSSKCLFPRLDKANKRGPPVSKVCGGFTSAAVSYKDGEVVGAAAPEIGQENKGRAMLEKMGWSTGTVLGAVNNTRGIVQPVTQTVKTGKAGLG